VGALGELRGGTPTECEKVLDTPNGYAQSCAVNSDLKHFSTSSVAPKPAKPQVLVVDDDITMRGILSETLVARGYEVCVAPRVEDVRAFYDAIHPRVVLLDWILPDGDGLQLLPEIKRQWPGTEVIMMTGYGAEEIAQRAEQLGAFYFLKKPFPLDALVAAVRSACQQSSRAEPGR
jgi:DNA-binding NtrC family response regulator